MKFFKSNRVIDLLIGIGILFSFFFCLDQVVMSWIMDFHQSTFPGRPLFDIVNRGIEIMDQGSTLTIVILVCYGIGKFFNKKLYEVAKYSLAGFITSGLMIEILKHLIGRGRPRLTAQLDHLNPLIFIGPTMQENIMPSL